MWQVTKLDVVPLLNNLSNVVLNVHWKLTLTYQGITDSIEGVYPLDPPSQETFVDYNNLTEEQVLDWIFNAPVIKERFKYPLDKASIEKILLDRLKQKYDEQQTQPQQLPWS